MKGVLIGAGGFVGRHLARAMIARGDEVFAFDTVPPDESVGFEVEALDVVGDPVPMPDRPDVVFYLAQSPHYRSFPEQGEDLFGVNVVGALRAARAAAEAGASCFCYFSTGTVYAPGFEPMAEDRPLRRDHAYALSKVHGEEVLGLLQSEMHVLRVRPFGLYGPGQTGMLVPSIVARVREGQAVTVEGHPDDPADRDGFRISLTYVDDAVRILLDLAVAAPASGLHAVNLGGPEAISIRRLAEAAGRVLEVTPRVEPVERKRSSDYVADLTRLRAAVGPEFTPFEHALARTVVPAPASA